MLLRVAYGLLVLALSGCSGCALRQPVKTDALLGPVVSEAEEFVRAVADKMPEWDADEDFAAYESKELFKVKADIKLASEANSSIELLDAAATLHVDWDALVALDMKLHREMWI